MVDLGRHKILREGIRRSGKGEKDHEEMDRMQDTPWTRGQKFQHEQGWPERETKREMYKAYSDDCVKPASQSVTVQYQYLGHPFCYCYQVWNNA